MMTFVSTPTLRATAVAVLLFSSLDGRLCAGETGSDGDRLESAAPATGPAAAALLAEQVGEIANSRLISRAKKEKRIATAVRVAVVAATAYRGNSGHALAITLDLTAAAAAAAPSYAEVISNAASFAPAIARIDNAASQVRTAAFAAAKAPHKKRLSHVAAARSTAPAPRAESAEPSESEPVARSTGRSEDQDREEMPPSKAMKLAAGENHNFTVSAEAGVRHDDNIFITSANKVGDTIYSLTPGVEFVFGQNSLAHGSVVFKEAFTRYAEKTVPNVNLGTGQASFGYDNGDLTVGAGASYQQLYQNSSDVASLGGANTIKRQDVLSANANAEFHFTPKTSVSTGAGYNKTEYKAAGLVGTQGISVPLKFYYAITPKVSLSSGVDYNQSNPQGDGPSGKDFNYNVGARGDFTAKLSGQVSVGYQTRQVADNPKENLMSFGGNLNYAITAKTAAALNFSRNFSTGALGESLKNSSYSLRISSDPTPQWQFSTGLTYRDVEYGPVVFAVNKVPLTTDRRDGYWIGDIQITYLISNSLSTSFDYTIRNNRSNIPGVIFTDNIFSLSLGWRY